MFMLIQKFLQQVILCIIMCKVNSAYTYPTRLYSSSFQTPPLLITTTTNPSNKYPVFPPIFHQRIIPSLQAPQPASPTPLPQFPQFSKIFWNLSELFFVGEYINKASISGMRLSRVSAMFSTIHTKICIVGGGSGGLNISSNLLRAFSGSEMRIFEPSTIHYYQPGYTLIGGGIADARIATRPQKDILHRDIPVVYQAVARIDPTKNLIITDKGEEFTYDHLIITAGIQLNWDLIKGAKEAVFDPDSNVSSIYVLPGAVKTNRLVENFKGGKAIFTEPQMPIKCGGAPQKILYLSTTRWKNNGIPAQVQFNKTIEVMFGVPKYSQALAKIAEGYGIQVHFKSKLVEVKKDENIAVFDRNGQLVEEKFDLLHLVPPMKPPKFIADSGLSDGTGYVDIDKQTLRHKKYANIWAAGDCSNLPCSKTAAAIFSQTDVLIENMKSVIKNKGEPVKFYDGYSSCPIFIGNKKLLLAEFKYDNKLAETFFNDQEKPRRSFYHLKKDFFPFTYWTLMPRGLWAGKDGLRIW